jgi:predicted RNase H-like HicB family nuclease
MAKARVLLFQEWQWWVAQGIDIDVASQGGSPEEALTNIAEALVLQHQRPGAPLKALPDDYSLPKEAQTLEVEFAI